MLSDYNSTFINNVSKITCRIKSRETGTAILVLPKNNSDIVYVITAKHCIIGPKFDAPIEKESITIFVPVEPLNKRFEKIVLQASDRILLPGERKNIPDCAIIVLERKNHPKLPTIPYFETLNTQFRSENCMFRGFPKADSEFEGINIDVKYSASNVVTTNSHLSTLHGDALSNCKGFSGSGLFCQIQSKWYLCGIVYEFKEFSQPFKVCDFYFLNKFLSDNSCPEINVIESHSVDKFLNDHLNGKLAKEKNSKKYIPDIFIEIANIKDNARFFAHPTLFLQKVLEEVERLNFNEVNRLLDKLDLAPIHFTWSENRGAKVTLRDINGYIRTLRENLQHFHDTLFPYSFPWRTEKPLDESQIPSRTRYIFRDMKYALGGNVSSIMRSIHDRLNELALMSSRVLFIIGRAGQGKTNFVCDFAETVLKKRSIPCIFFTGHEFNHTSPERIDEYIVKSIFADSSGGIPEAFNRLNELAIQVDAPVIIIIDGINENQNIQAFSHHLERFIERSMNYEHLKFILTCRSEYFGERFSNFQRASFANEIHFVYDLEKQMSEVHKDRLLDGYFRFFNLSRPYISPDAAEILENDTLLLRIFCDTYGKTGEHQKIQIPPIIDIYRDKIFREYLTLKLEGANEFSENSSRINIRKRSKFLPILRYIIQLMIEHRQYTDIAISKLPAEYDDALGILLGEDVIIRKDLISRYEENILADNLEVINFTFDEFRDFLIADLLVTVIFQQDPRHFEEVIDHMIIPGSSVAEGVRTYLFLASRRPNNRDVLAVIKRKDWYNETFMRSIFTVEEDFITSEDLNEIKARFYENPANALWISQMLIWRWRTDQYPRLNIHVLFKIFNGLDKHMYDKLIKSHVDTWRTYTNTPKSWFELVIEEIYEDIEQKRFFGSSEFINLIEMLIYFFPLGQKHEFFSPPYSAFTMYAEYEPHLAIELLRKHTHIPHIEIRAYVWRALASIAREHKLPDELMDEACHMLLDTVSAEQEDIDSWIKELVRFLENYAIQQQIWYATIIADKMRQHTSNPYFYEQFDDNEN